MKQPQRWQQQQQQQILVSLPAGLSLVDYDTGCCRMCTWRQLGWLVLCSLCLNGVLHLLGGCSLECAGLFRL